MSAVWRRFRSMMRRWFTARKADTALNEEIQSYLEIDIEAKIRSGMSPQEARRAARIEFGGVEQVREETRQSRTGAGIDNLIQDFRYAARTLVQAPGFSLSVVGSLAVGIAAVVAAFAFLNGWLLRPYPGVVQEERLIRITVEEPCTRGDCWQITTTSPKDYLTLRSALTTLDGLAVYTFAEVAARIPTPVSLSATLVSENYFEVLKMRPRIGQMFSPEEGTLDHANVAVISHDLWTCEFGAAPDVIGRTIFIANQSVQIIGVAAPSFSGMGGGIGTPGSTIWLPLPLADLVSSPHMTGKMLLPPGERRLEYFGRLKDDSDISRVRAQAAGLVLRTPKPLRAAVGEFSRGVRSKPLIFSVIMPIPVLVLFLACLNAANLLLVRASRRNREIAIRLAIGASRWRVVRQLLIESLLLAAISTVFALPLAWAGLQAAAGYLRVPTPMDFRVLTIAVVCAALSALGFGLAPAFLCTRVQPARALGSSQSGGDGTPERTRGRRVLVVAQVAMSLGLLAAGTQLVSAFRAIDRTVAGVVEAAYQPTFSRDGKPAPAIYVPIPLRDELALALYVRSQKSAEALKTPLGTAVRQIDPRVPFISIVSLDELNERERLPHTGMSRAATFLGIIALILATVGLYAVVSFIMNSRLREIAIRLTLGAQPRTVFDMVLRQAMRMVITGAVLGGVVAYAVSQIVRSQVHGTLGVDKLTFAGSVVVLLVPMLLASAIPAIRAMRTDPAKFLRSE